MERQIFSNKAIQTGINITFGLKLLSLILPVIKSQAFFKLFECCSRKWHVCV